MTVHRPAYLRLLAVCAAWALGAALVWQVGAYGLDPVVPAVFAAGALVLTQDLGRGGRGSGEPKYWRGRRIDDHDRPRRRN